MTHISDGKLHRLGEVELFRGCSDVELAEIAGVSDVVDVAPGEVLCRQGHVDRRCIVVVEGTAAIEVSGELVGTVGPGESIGERSLLTNGPRSATVAASTPMTVYVIDGDRFDAVLATHPQLTITLLRRAAIRLQQVYLVAGRPEAS